MSALASVLKCKLLGYGIPAPLGVDDSPRHVVRNGTGEAVQSISPPVGSIYYMTQVSWGRGFQWMVLGPTHQPFHSTLENVLY